MTAFLDTLGVGHDASERDVRRAYATRLKRIDAEADPAGFQALREAYETALAWLRHRDAGHEPESADDVPAQIVDDTGAVPQGAPAPEPAAPAPHELAAAVFDEIFVSPCEHPQMATERLQRALDDVRVVDLEAREHFEARVAVALAEGWRPGHHLLWEAALRCFGWDTDHGRLQRFGRAGHVLDNALVERDLFERQPVHHRQGQWELMKTLRTDAPPAEDVLVRNICVLEWLIQAFPNWLWVTTDAEAVQRWRDAHAALPRSRQSMASARPAPLDAEPPREGGASSRDYREESLLSGPMLMWALALIIVMVIGKVVGDDLLQRRKPAPPAAPLPILFPREVARLTEPPVTPEKCRDAEALARDYAMGPKRFNVNFGFAFDALIVDCTNADLWSYNEAYYTAKVRVGSSPENLARARAQRAEVLRQAGLDVAPQQ